MTTPKPTATELIERIDALLCYRDHIDITFSSTHHPKVNLLESLRHLRAHLNDPWISVEERLPTHEECSQHDGKFQVRNGQEWKTAHFIAGKFRRLINLQMDMTKWVIVEVTHWAPLPPLPQKAGEE